VRRRYVRGQSEAAAAAASSPSTTLHTSNYAPVHALALYVYGVNLKTNCLSMHAIWTRPFIYNSLKKRAHVSCNLVLLLSGGDLGLDTLWNSVFIQQV
jgi:hypothetical protein